VKDCWRTLRGPAESRTKIERSQFLGIAFPASTEEAFFEALDRIARRHFDASHHCWAFRLFDGERARSADAGEPSGTAGRPILSAIEAEQLFDVGLVVVRWFGGVKLGTGGLSRAYRQTALETLRQGEVVERFLYDRICVAVPFDRIADVYRLVSPPSIVLAGEAYGEVNEFSFDVRQSLRDEFLRMLAARRLTPR